MASKNTIKDATETMETIAADTQKAAKEQFDKLASGFEKLNSFGQENMDAMVKSSEIATKAAEGISAEVTEYTKKSFETGVAAAQDFAASKNVTELFEKQTAFAKAYFEDMVKQTTKMNEMMTATAKDVAGPLNARVSAASEAMKAFTV